MPEPGSKEEYRAVQAELMRAKTYLIRAQTELAKAKTLKVKRKLWQITAFPTMRSGNWRSASLGPTRRSIKSGLSLIWMSWMRTTTTIRIGEL